MSVCQSQPHCIIIAGKYSRWYFFVVGLNRYARCMSTYSYAEAAPRLRGVFAGSVLLLLHSTMCENHGPDVITHSVSVCRWPLHNLSNLNPH